jgi:hypothetical protein
MRAYRAFALFLSLACCAVLAAFAESPTPLHLHGGVGHLSVRSKVGGEQHDAYMLELEAGRTVRIALSARGGKASFSVCNSDNYSDAEPVGFGKRSPDGKSWTGEIPVRKVYYVYVTAYPEARYTLSLWVK